MPDSYIFVGVGEPPSWLKPSTDTVLTTKWINILDHGRVYYYGYQGASYEHYIAWGQWPASVFWSVKADLDSILNIMGYEI